MPFIALVFAVLAVLVADVTHAQDTPKSVLMLDTGGHMAVIRTVAFTPDGKQLVSASDDKAIRVWDLVTGRTVRTLRGESALGPAGKIYAMALSPNGKWLTAGGLLHPTIHDPLRYAIRLYDFASGRLVALLKGHTGVVHGLAFSPDSRHLISGSGLGDTTAIIWDVETQRLKHRLTGHSAEIYAVGFTPDGQRAVTGSYDHELWLWRVADGAQIARMTGHGDKVRSLAVGPDGAIVSGDMSGEMRLWDGATGALRKVLARQGTSVGSLRASPDGKRLLSGVGYQGLGNDCHVYDLATGQETVTYSGHHNTVLATAISQDGRWAATGGNPEIHIWDIATGKRRLGPDGQPLTLGGQGRPVWAVGFSPDGTRIGWGNEFVYQSHNDRGSLQYEFVLLTSAGALPRPRAIQATEVSGFRRAAASSGEWTLEHRRGGNYSSDAILDIKRVGKPVISIQRGPIDGYDHRAYSFTPDGETIISGGMGGVLTAYDRAGAKRGGFIGHEGDVWAVTPSPDGRFLVSGSADQTVRLWNLATRELLVTLVHGRDGEWVMWTPEGFFIASENGGRLVGWHINQGPDKEARFVTAEQVRKLFNRPDLVAAKIEGGEANDRRVREEAERLDIDRILASGPAPEIGLLTPGDGWQAGDKTVTITAQVTDKGGGIGRLELRVNKAVKGTSFGRAGRVSFDVELASPDNLVEIIAYNRDGFVESSPVGVRIAVDRKALLGVPDLHVLAIGVNSYRDVRRKLDHAVSDASTLGEALKEAGRKYYRNEPNVVIVPEKDVSAARLTTAFDELGKRVKATDVFVFFIAGHGKTLRGDYYFVPPHLASFDADAILAGGFGPEQWREWFKRIKAEKSVFIFDTCESGSVGAIFKTRGGDYDTSYRRLADATGRVVLMAASDQQVAVEGYRGHGVFTYAVLEALAKADRNGNNEIELMELIEHVDVRVPEISRALKACQASGPADFCQKPEVNLDRRPFYTLVPRYPDILARIESGDVATIPTTPTHALLRDVDVLEKAGRGAAARKLKRGDQVARVKTDGEWMLVAKDGAVLGYVENRTDILLELNR